MTDWSDDTQNHRAILEMGVSIWNQWRASEPLTAPDLRGADLSGLELENINFARADLRGANLTNAYLYDADFQQGDLRGAILTRAMLVGANLCKANLSEAVLERAYLNQSDLSYANLTGACLQEADLQAALLMEATLVNARLASAEMSESEGLTVLQIKAAKDSQLAFLRKDLMCLPASESGVRPAKRVSNVTRNRRRTLVRSPEVMAPREPVFKSVAV
ncbi:MAG: pentapeptide repeat-containing protein [Cyanobacteria bacterium J06555_13]